MHVLSKLFGLTLLFIVIFGTTSNGQTTINIISTGDAGPTSGTNWSISGTTLTATGTANIQASVIETALSSGNLTVVSGTGSEYRIQVSDPIDYTGATERTLTFGATHQILVYQNISSTSAPLNIIIASSIDRTTNFTSTGEGVGLISSTITTNGGDVWIGGGELTGSWNGHTVGVGAAMAGPASGIGVEISGSSISTAGGDVRILGTSKTVYTPGGQFVNSEGGISAFSAGATINSGAGDVELISDIMGFDWPGNIYNNYSSSQGEIQIDGTGTLTIAPLEGSFANAVTWDATESGGYYTSTGGGNTIDGLKIKDTLGLTIGKSTNTANVTISNAIDVAGPITVYGGDVTVSQNLTSTASNADILLKASGTIEIQDNTGIETNGGDLILWSNSDNVNGGNVLMGQNVTLDSRQGGASTGGGHIHIAGGADSNADGFPDDATAGIGNSAGGSAYGILFGNAAPSGVQLLSGGGDITLIGGVDGNFNSGANSHGIGFYPGYTINAGAGSISFTGSANSGGGTTIGIDLMTFGAQNTSSITTTGGLTLNGVTTVANGGGNHGIIIDTGLTLDAGTVDVIGDSDDANIILNGSVVSDGAIQLKADLYSFSSGSISGQGTLTIEPLTASNSFSSAFSNSSLTLGSALTGLTIGKSTNTANITIGDATSIAGPITIYGGTITLDADLTSTATGAAILLKGSGDINQATNIDVSTNGGNVTYWADSDNNSIGGIALNPTNTNPSSTSITTSGGDIVLGGGSDPLADDAWGDVAGVNIYQGTSLNASTGNISIRGSSYRLSSLGYGVQISNVSGLDGNNITIHGSGPAGSGNAGSTQGVRIATSTITSNGTLDIVGVGV
jgi:hypothetical protein